MCSGFKRVDVASNGTPQWIRVTCIETSYFTTDCPKPWLMTQVRHPAADHKTADFKLKRKKKIRWPLIIHSSLHGHCLAALEQLHYLLEEWSQLRRGLLHRFLVYQLSSPTTRPFLCCGSIVFLRVFEKMLHNAAWGRRKKKVEHTRNVLCEKKI